jgi:ketosteroid isomerase-like protein
VRPLIVLTLIVLLPCLIVGQTDKKAQKTAARTVDFVRSGKLKIGVWKISDRKIRIFGDMAVITQEEQYTDSYSGATDISGAYRVTLVFGKTENGQWQELVWQSTKEQGSQRH